MDNGNDNTTYVTEEGLRKLEEELDYLVHVRRPEVARQIAEAKADGDVSENAGYDEAKTAQGFLEGKIRDLEAVLKNARLIDESEAPKHAVAIGRTIKVCEVGSDMEENYTIVGSKEADPANGRISNESPMGKALLGKAVGDVVKVPTPSGQMEFKILGVS